MIGQHHWCSFWGFIQKFHLRIPSGTPSIIYSRNAILEHLHKFLLKFLQEFVLRIYPRNCFGHSSRNSIWRRSPPGTPSVNYLYIVIRIDPDSLLQVFNLEVPSGIAHRDLLRNFIWKFLQELLWSFLQEVLVGNPGKRNKEIAKRTSGGFRQWTISKENS